MSLTIKGNSDTVLAMPLAAQPVFVGKVSSRASAGAMAYNINVSVATDWAANQFAALYYVRFTSGVRSGMYYTITQNTGNQLKLDTAGDDLSAVAVGETFEIVPYWTLGGLFPPAIAGTDVNPLTPSADFTPGQRKSEIFLPDNLAAGTNLTPSRHFFFTASGWVADKAGNAVADDTILPPDSYFIVRQPATIAGDAPWTALGQVIVTKVVIPLATRAAGKQDNSVALSRPVPVRLADAGLESGFVDSAGMAGFQKRDSLLVFDNSKAGYNKSASRSYIRVNGTWFADTMGQPVADNELIAPGSGLVIRKYRNAGATTARWTNLPGYTGN